MWIKKLGPLYFVRKYKDNLFKTGSIFLISVTFAWLASFILKTDSTAIKILGSLIFAYFSVIVMFSAMFLAVNIFLVFLKNNLKQFKKNSLNFGILTTINLLFILHYNEFKLLDFIPIKPPFWIIGYVSLIIFIIISKISESREKSKKENLPRIVSVLQGLSALGSIMLILLVSTIDVFELFLFLKKILLFQ